MNDQDLRGAFDGIGVVVELKDKKLTVVAPQEDSPGEKAGIQPGDIVLEVNQKKIASVKQFISEINGIKSGQVIRLLLRREGDPYFVALPKP